MGKNLHNLLHKLIKSVEPEILFGKLGHFIIAGCSCSDYVNRNGHGQCKESSSRLGNKVSCYVNLPTTCKDKIQSGTDPDKWYSHEACLSNGKNQKCAKIKRINPINLRRPCILT